MAEINGAFISMLPALRDANLNIQDNAAATIDHADGRTFSNGRGGTYDAIVNSIPSPTYFSASRIYTVEFYDRVRRALKADGVFSTWLSAADMSEEGLRVILSAFHQSLAYCDLRLVRWDYYMATCSALLTAPR